MAAKKIDLRQWQDLDPAQTYTVRLFKGWRACVNHDGSVIFLHKEPSGSVASKTLKAGPDGGDTMTIDPDPGRGKP
jgi:hypothetical protein